MTFTLHTTRSGRIASLMIAAAAVAACGGGDRADSSGSSEKSTTTVSSSSKNIKGDKAVVTIEGGAMDGSYTVPLMQCELDSKRLNVASEKVNGHALLWMFDTEKDGTANFQIVKNKENFWDGSTPINYTIDGGNLSGSGGVMRGDGGKVSVELTCG